MAWNGSSAAAAAAVGPWKSSRAEAQAMIQSVLIKTVIVHIDSLVGAFKSKGKIQTINYLFRLH